ncbi:MAG: hypothetical protein M0T70_13900 [Geobacteraceae bacterium]|nr:hypothetical protein [Geobacteraceae bacterium]
MKRVLFALGLMLLPGTLFAEDCQVVEFPDHFDVTCVGDAKPVPIPKQGLIRTQQQPAPQAPVQAPVPAQTPDRQSTAGGQADSPASAPAATSAPPAASAPSGASGMPYLRKPGRQGRPSTADMNAAIEARRRLILQMRSNNPSQ